jgi:hypothetical protein
MKTVDLKGWIKGPDPSNKEFEYVHHVPENRIIKEHVEKNIYRVLLVSFNTHSPIVNDTFIASAELIKENMDRLVGKLIGEIDQSQVRFQLNQIKDYDEYSKRIKTIDGLNACGTLLSYEIKEHSDSNRIDLYGTIDFTTASVNLFAEFPKYMSIRAIGTHRSFDSNPILNVREIICFDVAHNFP